jgi:hypothetical protein
MRELVYSFEPAETEQALGQWLAMAADSPDKGWTRGELVTHIREEHSTFSWLLETMLQRAGFEIRHVEHAATWVHSTYTCVRK